MNSVAPRVFLALFALPAYAQQPSAKGVNFYSPAWETRLGQQAAAVLSYALPVIHEPKLDQYIAKLTSELAKHAGHQFAITFTLYEDRKPRPAQVVELAMPVDALQGQATEPVAIAGGPIFVPLSLLADAPSEAVFAFQLAHAVAHVSLRHATRLATREEILNMSVVQNVVRVSLGGWIAANQRLAMRVGFLNFARRFELDADTVATAIAAEAGYNPQEVVQYLEGQPAPEGRRIFSAHPAAEGRVKAVTAALEKLASRVYSAATGEFDEVKALAAAIR